MALTRWQRILLARVRTDIAILLRAIFLETVESGPNLVVKSGVEKGVLDFCITRAAMQLESYSSVSISETSRDPRIGKAGYLFRWMTLILPYDFDKDLLAACRRERFCSQKRLASACYWDKF